MCFYVSTHVCAGKCGYYPQSPAEGVGVFCHSPPIPFRQGLSLNLGFASWLGWNPVSTPQNWYYRHFLECLVYYTNFEIWTLVPMMVGQALLTAETTSTAPIFCRGWGLLLFLLSWDMVSCDATRPWIPDPLTTACWNHRVRQKTWPTVHPFLVSTHPPSTRDFRKNKLVTYIQSHEHHLMQWARFSLHFSNVNLKQHPGEKSRAVLWTPVTDLGIRSLCVL